MREVIDIYVSAEMQSVAAAMEVLGNETRLSVYTLLVPVGRSGLTAGNSQKKLAIPALTLSDHKSRLIRLGLVSQERQGRKLSCRANYRRVEGVLSFLARNCCVDVATFPARRQQKRRIERGP